MKNLNFMKKEEDSSSSDSSEWKGNKKNIGRRKTMAVGKNQD